MNLRRRRKSGKKATSADASSISRDNSPVKSVSKHSAQKLQQAPSQFKNGNKNVHGVPEIPLADSRNGSSKSLVSPRGPKAWAGPSYYSSPPPEHLPMPTSFLLAV